MGVKAGVDPLALWKAVRQGATGRRRTFDGLMDKFLPGTYDPPSFALKLGHKDVSLATALGREVGVPMRLANLALEELTEALNRGWGDKDSSSFMRLETERAGIELAVPPETLREVIEHDTRRDPARAISRMLAPPRHRPPDHEGDSAWNSARSCSCNRPSAEPTESSTSAASRSRRPPRIWASPTCGWPSTTSRRYGYLSRPLTYAPAPGEQDEAASASAPRSSSSRCTTRWSIAEEIATVDILTGGRLDIGLGRGYQRYEFERLGQDLAESRSRWEEAVDIILLALERQAVQLRRQVLQDSRDDRVPAPGAEAAPADLGHRAEPGLDRDHRAPRLSTSCRAASACRSSGCASSAASSTSTWPTHPPEAPDPRGHAAARLRHRQRGRRARRRRAGPLEHARDAEPAQQLRARRATATRRPCPSRTSRAPTICSRSSP